MCKIENLIKGCRLKDFIEIYNEIVNHYTKQKHA